MKYVIILALMATLPVLAQGTPPEPEIPSADITTKAFAGSVADSVSKSAAVAALESANESTSSALAKGGEGIATATSGDSSALAEGGEQKTTVLNDLGDTTSNVEYTYKQPPLALAGKADTLIVGCREVFGFDFRGAGNDAAGGATFGVPHTNERCKLDEAIVEAFASDDLELGWGLWCSQKEVWKGVRKIQRAVHGQKVSQDEAIKLCFESKRDADQKDRDATAKRLLSEQAEQYEEKIRRMDEALDAAVGIATKK